METPQPQKTSLKTLGSLRRTAVTISPDSLIKVEPLQAGNTLPLTIQPAMAGVNIVAWATSQRAFIEAHLLQYGAILFRNFPVQGAADFEQFIIAVSGALLEYRERSSPRTQVQGNIYTSTDYPADQSIFVHNENSYQRVWPSKIFFFCHTPAIWGGETPITDCRKVFTRIDAKIRERFLDKGWMHVRNFGDGFGLPWQTVFQTTDRAAVEEYCRHHGLEVEWKAGDRLRTRAVAPIVAQHPKTGELVWFNHATFFHVSTLEPHVHRMLLAEFREEDLPANTYYGDGSPIEPAVLDHLRQAYGQETVTFPWHRGDILLLDNMLVAHGRAPYRGPRKVLVGMSEPHNRQAM